jgi:hypothetical protein
MKKTIMSLYILTVFLSAGNFETPHNGITLKQFSMNKLDKQKKYAFNTIIKTIKRDNYKRPMAKVKVPNYKGNVWCMYLIRADSLKKNSNVRVLGFLKDGKTIAKEFGINLKEYGIKNNDPVIFTIAYFDIDNKKAAYVPGGDKDWDEWSKGKYKF